MKNCIVQFHVDAETYDSPEYNNISVNQKLLPFSFESVKRYSEKINVDHVIVNEKRINWIHPTFERFDLFFNNNWWKEYENILYLDTDLIVWNDAPDIFEMYRQPNKFKICYDRIARRRSKQWHEKNASSSILEEFDGYTLAKNRFNAGVFMLDKTSAKAMAEYLDYKNLVADDNVMLIYAMLKSGVGVEQMDWRFNKKNGYNCWFGHAFGQEKFNWSENNPFVVKARQQFPNIDF
jgi:lipopolysaccharide biosynthesis glycosyltransferase